MQVTHASGEQHQHVAVLAFPFGTHAGPLLSLVRRLAAAAPHVRFSFFTTERFNASIFTGSIISKEFENIKSYNVGDGVPQGHKLSGHTVEAIGFFMKAAPDIFNKAIEEAAVETGRTISCLVTDAFFWFAGKMAEEMRIPWVPVWTAGPCALSVHIHTDTIRQNIGVSQEGNEEETLNFIAGCSAIRAGDLPEGVISGDLEGPLSRLLHNMGQTLPQATTVAINSFEELDPSITNDLKSKLNKFLNVGPFTLFSPTSNLDEHGCLEWLDKHEAAASVAYISFGSFLTPPPNELVALAEALEESGIPFLWSFRGNVNDHLPKEFHERTAKTWKGKFVPWAPQLQVLAHASTGIFITHCGWNSITESITSGVPMICRPFLGDQRLNMRVVQDVWSIGVGVEHGFLNKSETMGALRLIVSQGEGKKMRENIKALKDLAIKAVGSNGSSVRNFKTLLEVITETK